jgi:CubicO group peptidase (beta-lactamase class C family)
MARRLTSVPARVEVPGVSPDTPGPATPEVIAADPHRAGFDPQRLRRLDGFLSRLTSSGKIPGWSIAIQRRSVLAHLSAGGHRDVAAGLPVEPGTMFRIYSMTKPVTAVAAMVLYERGDIELSDPVARFLPAFDQVRVFTGGSDVQPVTEPAVRPITLWHLLTHTAGLTYGFHRAHPVDALYRQAGHDIEAPAGCSPAEACETWARLPLLFQPGAEWNYSVATDVLGHVVEIVSGQSLGDFCADQIFRPLGMPDTTFTVLQRDWRRLARLYRITAAGRLTPDETLAATVTQADRGNFGGSGLVSTTGDYLRFAGMLLNQGALGGTRILGPQTVRFMLRNHLPDDRDLRSYGRPMNAESPLGGVGQGLGVSVVLDPVRAGYLTSPGEAGWGGAASTVFWADPAQDLLVVFMTQALPSAGLPIRGKLHQLVHQAIVD